MAIRDLNMQGIIIDNKPVLFEGLSRMTQPTLNREQLQRKN